MIQYLNLLKEVLDNGTKRPSGREGMPDTISIFGSIIKIDLMKGFPLLTTKKMFIKGILTELIWFLHGDTNIKFLLENDVNIWNKDAYRWYLSNSNGNLSLDEYIEKVKKDSIFCKKYGDLGRIYGAQWRRWGSHDSNGGSLLPINENDMIVDQVQDAINTLKSNKFNRRVIITAWNPSELNNMALPPCHVLYHFNVRSKSDGDYLDMLMYQRSCDAFLGVPFNLASGATFLFLMCKILDYKLGILNWVGGDIHIYENHLDQVKEQIERDPLPLCNLKISDRKDLSLDNISLADFVIENYVSHDKIKAEMSAGI